MLDFFDWRGATSGTIRRFHYAEDDTPVSCDMASLVRMVASGRLHVEIGLLDDWVHTAEALDALLARRLRGNAVLTLPSKAIPASNEWPDKTTPG